MKRFQDLSIIDRGSNAGLPVSMHASFHTALRAADIERHMVRPMNPLRLIQRYLPPVL